mmetsp:Transcript_51771/g.102256  ORF Transcript_51771/g.102256 Transcript_51771/m.102256 type:complete len:398 (-) Transcript_51771:138-1331(-)
MLSVRLGQPLVPVVSNSEVESTSPCLSSHVWDAAISVTRVDEDLVLVDELRVQREKIGGGLVVLHASSAGSDVKSLHDRGLGQPGIHGGLSTAGVVVQGLSVTSADLEGVSGVNCDGLLGEGGAQSGHIELSSGTAAVVVAALVVDVVYIKVSDLSLHLRQSLDTGRVEGTEVTACLNNLLTKVLRVHTVAEVEVSRDLLGFSGREGAGAHSVTPAAVADSSTNEVHLGTHGVSIDLLDKHGDVNTGVGFASDVELVGLVLGVRVEEVGQELVGVLSSGLVGVHAVRALGGTLTVRESNTLGGLKVQHVGHGGPSIGVGEHLGNAIHLVGEGVVIGHDLSILSQKTNERRRTRSTVQPQNDRVSGGIVGGLDEPVVKVALDAGQSSSWDVAGVVSGR